MSSETVSDPYAWKPPTFKGSPPYEWTDDMGELSGFGGGYEDACRMMLAAALAWLDAHPDAKPLYKGFVGVVGILADDNLDAKALSDAAIAACPDGPTGAMHQAAITAALWVSKNGWEKFAEQKREQRVRERAEEAKNGS